MGRLIIDGNKVYEIDEDCLKRKRKDAMNEKEHEKQTKEAKRSIQSKHTRREG